MSSKISSMMIAPFKTGLDTDVEPWIAPPDSFREAINVHIKHGFVEKRSGYYLFSTLEKGLRVMGFLNYIASDGTKQLLAFDTRCAYVLEPSNNVFSILDPASDVINGIFDSGQYDYIHGVNWQSSGIANRLYFSNGKGWNGQVDPDALNGIRYFSSASSTQTVLFTPEISNVTVGSVTTIRTLYGGKLLFTIGQYIVVLYTFEHATPNAVSSSQEFPQRARWCSEQNPENWNDVIAGGGGYIDAATGDQIISAQALKNQIIVFFTNSVWALKPTGLPTPAFIWVRLNNYRACDGKMASVSYDKVAIALGVRGITATDGTQTERIDERIVDFTTQEINGEQFKKVFCFRSYQSQRWYTLYAASTGLQTENTGALVYDDESKAFTTYDIALNCIGYGNSDFQYALSDFTLANGLDLSLDEFGEDTLLDWAIDQNEEILLGGDTLGNIFQLEVLTEDLNSAIDASFTTAAWNPYINEGIESQLPYVDFYVDTDKMTTASIEFYVNDQVNPYITQSIAFLPNLNFVAGITLISNANPCIVSSPEHGLFTTQQVFIYGVAGMKEVNGGPYSVTVINANSFSLNGIDSTIYGAWTNGGGVYLKEFYQTKAWVRAYGGGTGYTHWLKVTLNGGERPFRLHAIKCGFRPRGKRLIN